MTLGRSRSKLIAHSAIKKLLNSPWTPSVSSEITDIPLTPYPHRIKTPASPWTQRYDRPGNLMLRLKPPHSTYCHTFTTGTRKHPKPGNYSALLATLLARSRSFAALPHHPVLKCRIQSSHKAAAAAFQEVQNPTEGKGRGGKAVTEGQLGTCSDTKKKRMTPQLSPSSCFPSPWGTREGQKQTCGALEPPRAPNRPAAPHQRSDGRAAPRQGDGRPRGREDLARAAPGCHPGDKHAAAARQQLRRQPLPAPRRPAAGALPARPPRGLTGRPRGPQEAVAEAAARCSPHPPAGAAARGPSRAPPGRVPPAARGTPGTGTHSPRHRHEPAAPRHATPRPDVRAAPRPRVAPLPLSRARRVPPRPPGAQSCWTATPRHGGPAAMFGAAAAAEEDDADFLSPASG